MRRTFDSRQPKEWLASGTWPEGEFEADAPDVLAFAVAVAASLSRALDGRNKSEVAKDAGITRSTLYDILAGNTWADMVTLGKLQAALGAPLWPDEAAPELRRVSH